jgi:hypothetical protein
MHAPTDTVNPTGADQSLIWHMIMRESMVGSMIEQ